MWLDQLKSNERNAQETKDKVVKQITRATVHPRGYIKASAADWIMVTGSAGSYPSRQYLTSRNAP